MKSRSGSESTNNDRQKQIEKGNDFNKEGNDFITQTLLTSKSINKIRSFSPD